MKTFFFCPSRHTRAIACASFAGFQSGSYNTSLHRCTGSGSHLPPDPSYQCQYQLPAMGDSCGVHRSEEKKEGPSVRNEQNVCNVCWAVFQILKGKKNVFPAHMCEVCGVLLAHCSYRLAPMRFRPTPPALEDSRKTISFASGRLKRSTSSCRRLMGVLPSSWGRGRVHN